MAYLAIVKMESYVCVDSCRVIIHDRQDEYYKAISGSNDAADPTVFIEFMLSAIKDALIETVEYNKPVKSSIN